MSNIVRHDGNPKDKWDTARFYEIKGRRLPSVTTILSVIAKPALLGWVAKQEREYFKHALQKLLRSRARITPEAVEEIAKEGKAAEKAKQAAADTGKLLHSAIEAYLKGRRVRVDEDVEEAFELWRSWWKASGLKILKAEETVYDLRLGYAGTLDALVRDGRQVLLVDWKSTNGIYGEHHLQNIAYRHACTTKTDAGLLVRIPKTGQGKVEEHEADPDLTIDDFTAVLRTWKVVRTLEGRPVK